ncbi:MAG: hypothetical protein U1E15_01980 [Hyphomicrobiales bacterium]
MCDYSLEVYGSVPAREGERYVTSRFPSGTIGLVSENATGTAVCLACDTPLAIDAIPKRMRQQFGLKEREEAVFIRLETGAYRDGFRFNNGQEVCLQQFDVGCGVQVRSLLENGFDLEPVELERAYLGA